MVIHAMIVNKSTVKLKVIYGEVMEYVELHNKTVKIMEKYGIIINV